MPKPQKRKASLANSPKLPVAPEISAERVLYAIRARFNPIPNLTPQLLGTHLESFRLGFLRNAAIVWDAMEERDYTLASVAPKRKKDAARHGWEVLAVNDTPEAKAQKEKLDYFFNNLTATTALEGNESGGMSLLLRQMMDAVGKRYAVHELIWEPTADGNLTATFKFCPLWWFENTTGRLRFLPSEFSVYGADMQPFEWMVTTGDGLMKACSVCYIFKGLSLKDWVAFNEKLATPMLVGKTSAAKDSPEWDALMEAVQNMGQDFGAVVNDGATIETVETSKTGDAQFEPMVDKMDRGMVTLWRGGDLGTSSRKDATGSNRQEDEAEILQQDDGQLLSETLTNQVSRFVLQYFFGDAPQLAYIKIKTGEKSDVAQDLLVDEFLLGAGFPLSIESAGERYGRPIPDASDELLTAPASPTAAPGDDSQIANTASSSAPSPEFIAASKHEYVQALATDLRPVMDQLNAILQIEDNAVFESRLRAFLKNLDARKADLGHDPASAQKLYEIISAGLANGLAQQKRKS